MLTLRGSRSPRRGAALDDLGMIRDGAVLIRDGVIAQAGLTRRVENLVAARGAEEIDATGRVVMPGFVDSHTHLIYPPRGEHGADEESAARAMRTRTARLLAARSQPFLDVMARHGTTTVEVKTGCGPDEAAEVKALRALAGMQGNPIDVVRTFLLRVPSGLPTPTRNRSSPNCCLASSGDPSRSSRISGGTAARVGRRSIRGISKPRRGAAWG